MRPRSIWKPNLRLECTEQVAWRERRATVGLLVLTTRCRSENCQGRCAIFEHHVAPLLLPTWALRHLGFNLLKHCQNESRIRSRSSCSKTGSASSRSTWLNKPSVPTSSTTHS